MSIRLVLFAGCVVLATSVPAAQQAATVGPAGPVGEAAPSLDAVVVTGERRGAAAGGIPPENILTRADVRATGATDINELLDALAPQIGSVRGRDEEPAILLLDGQRVSGFRELRDIPVDAIDRVEVLPEAVSLTYGYPAHQRVVNVVLRRQFRSTAGLIRGTAASDGGYASGAADLTRVTIGEGVRNIFNLRADGNSGLTESEREVQGDATSPWARSLVGSRRGLRGTVTHGRRVGAVGVAGNLELGHQEERALTGLEESPGRTGVRDTTRENLHAGLALSGRTIHWHWSATGNAGASRDREEADRDGDAARERAATRAVSGDIELVANGALFQVPAGAVGMTVGAGLRRHSVDSDSGEVDRNAGSALVSIDFPVGDLLFNLNGRTERLSDLGNLQSFGAGIHWSPASRLAFAANWTREDAAPSVQQVAGAVIETPGTRLADFGTGTATVGTLVTGGNAHLQLERRSILLMGANWRVTADGSFRLRADYARSRLDGPVYTPFGASPAFEAAFPERFTRDEAGNLSRLDVRPVNVESARRDVLRLGFDLSLPSGSVPPADGRRSQPDQQGDIPMTGPPSGGPAPMRTLFAPTDARRFTLSLTDTITFVDDMTLRGPLKLDALHGDAVGPTGARPRHEVEGRMAYHHKGIGGLLSARWRSSTDAKVADDSTLHFPAYAALDLRVFVHLDQQPDLVSRHSWLEGVTLRLEISNLFNTRPKARDNPGNTPSGMQGVLFEPIGRTIGISFSLGGGGIGG